MRPPFCKGGGIGGCNGTEKAAFIEHWSQVRIAAPKDARTPPGACHFPLHKPKGIAFDGIGRGRTASGPGALNGDLTEIEQLVFRRDWLRKISVNAGSAALARATGESMSAGIQPGDRVLIDTAKMTLPEIEG